jgi:TonB family protein
MESMLEKAKCDVTVNKKHALSGLRVAGFVVALFFHVAAIILLSLSASDPSAMLAADDMIAQETNRQVVMPEVQKKSKDKPAAKNAAPLKKSLSNKPVNKQPTIVMAKQSELPAIASAVIEVETKNASIFSADSDLVGQSDGIKGNGQGSGGDAGKGAGSLMQNLTPIKTPKPPYPRQSLRDSEQGIVILLIKVDVSGMPVSAAIVQSSGFVALDEATIKQVMSKWRWKPSMRDGVAVESYALARQIFFIGGGVM